MTEPKTRTPSETAARLEISPSALRRWTAEFADFMSVQAGDGPRRYTDDDLELLSTVKALLAEGQTYYQVGKHLEALRPTPAGGGPTALALTGGAGPVFGLFTDTLHSLSDGQQLLLGSQQANRDLMGVLLQDNFGLKEENTRLRDRMLDLERDLAELRRQDLLRREELAARLDRLEARSERTPAAPHTAPRATRSAASEERGGCLGSLLGFLS